MSITNMNVDNNMKVDNDPLELWCFIHGDTAPFRVIVPTHIDIDELKEYIHKKRTNTLRDIDPSNIILWKVTSVYRPTQMF